MRPVKAGRARRNRAAPDDLKTAETERLRGSGWEIRGRGEAFQRTLGTAEFHHLVGKYLAETEAVTKRQVPEHHGIK